jgi:alpha-L-rhamnosidase
LAIDAVTPQNAPVPCDLVGTAYFAHSTDLMARIAGVLGRKKDRIRFRKLHGQIVERFQKAYVTSDGRIVGHCQTSYLFALAFDLLPAGLRPKAFGHLVDLISARNDHLTTGFLGTPLLCPVLTRFGRTDLAYRLLLQEDYPSWLYTVKNGATTMWERWNSYTKEHGFGDVSMNSFNHYAYGAVGEWMYSVIGGIRPMAPGFKKILFAPEPGGGLTEATTSLQTPHGLASCHWRLRGRRLSVDLQVPVGVRAALRLPGRKPRALKPGHFRQTTTLTRTESYL